MVVVAGVLHRLLVACGARGLPPSRCQWAQEMARSRRSSSSSSAQLLASGGLVLGGGGPGLLAGAGPGLLGPDQYVIIM